MLGLNVRVYLGLAAALLAVFWSCAASAQVSGACANCHTMHNSQNAEPMAYALEGGSFVADTSANPNLLITDCVGCHSATDGSTWQESVTGAPIVFNVVEPQYGADAGDGKKQGLAGGNFYWVTQDDTYGHNVLTSDSNLDDAPGNPVNCQNDSCHKNLDRPFGGGSEESGRYGCQSCHMLEDIRYHHADDSGTPKVVNSAAKGWYRFLSGHKQGEGYGASGIEDSDWEHVPTSSDHNEYLGVNDTIKNQISGLSDFNTVTGFCVGCHGNFHIQDTTGAGVSPWIRHPSDRTLPNSGEYTGYTSFDPLIPVARPSLSTVSATVTPGTDMVMCLSCHRAHASPYYKMLRWDIKSADIATAISGCAKCHTSKN